MPNRHAKRATARTANQERGRPPGSGLRRFARQHPLMVVGLGVIAGMALGALLPWGSIDDEFLGEQAGKLKDGALDLASDSYEKVKSVIQSTYDAATEAAGVNRDGSGLADSAPSRPGEGYGTYRS